MQQRTRLDKRIMFTEALLAELEIVQPNSLQKTVEFLLQIEARLIQQNL